MTIHPFPPRARYWTEEDDYASTVYVCLHNGQLHKADTLPLLWASLTTHSPPSAPCQLQARAA